MFGVSVSKVTARVKLFWYITTPLLYYAVKLILTTPTFLLLEYDFISDASLEAKNAKGGNLNTTFSKTR